MSRLSFTRERERKTCISLFWRYWIWFMGERGRVKKWRRVNVRVNREF